MCQGFFETDVMSVIMSDYTVPSDDCTKPGALFGITCIQVQETTRESTFLFMLRHQR